MTMRIPTAMRRRLAVLFLAALVPFIWPSFPLAIAASDQPMTKLSMEYAIPLVEAAKAGDAALAQSLLEGENPQPDRRDALGRTALHYAARLGHQEIVDGLIAAGAAVDLADADGYAPLFRAVEFGQDEIAIRLLEAGADASRPLSDGRTPRSVAMNSGNDRMRDIFRNR